MNVIVRTNAVMPFGSNYDLTNYEGYAVTPYGTTGLITRVSATADDPLGVIVTGRNTSMPSDIAILAGYSGTIKLKLGGTVNAIGTQLQTRADGKFEPKSGLSRRVCAVALQTGVAEELIEAAIFNFYTT